MSYPGRDQMMISRSDLIADLKTLNHISQTLNHAVDVHAALNDALTHLVQLMKLNAGWIFLLDNSNEEKWYGKGYVLAAHYNLPPAMGLDNPEAWLGGCDCQGFFNYGKLNEAYNEVRCTRLSEVSGDRRDLAIHASVPLRAGGQTLGILNVAAPDWEAFSPRALALLDNAGAHMGTALERARLYDLLLERRVKEQAALLELSSQLLSRPDLEDLMDYLVRDVSRLMSVDACALLLPGEEADSLAFWAAIGWRSNPVTERLCVPAGVGSDAGQVMSTGRPLVVDISGRVDNLAGWFASYLPNEEFKSAAVVPLVIEERSIGLLAVNSRAQRHFEEDDLRFLQLMANQAAMAIEQARLRREEMNRQRLEEELNVGRRIQLSLLPKSCPTPPGWAFCDFYQAARQVGGDFFDYFELPGKAGRLGLVIADVADKGVPAALFMGVSRSIIRSAALGGRTPGEALERANDLLLKDSQAGLFLSAFYGVLDIEHGYLTYANAGHNPPLWYRASSTDFQSLGADGIVLCVAEKISLEEKTIQVGRGDILVLYTDGVTDAVNEQLDEFGQERLQEVVAANAHESASQILQAIVDAVDTFTGGMDQFDDFTLVLFKRH